MANLTLRYPFLHMSAKAAVQNSELFDEARYIVESDVDVDDFRTSLAFFQTQDEPFVTPDSCRAVVIQRRADQVVSMSGIEEDWFVPCDSCLQPEFS
jgi:hypothetical protein